MQNFLSLERIDPKKRNVLERIKDFKEIYQVYSDEEASPQADRCVQCGDPYCLNKCPLSNFIPQWLKKTSEKDMELAFMISNESSPFPEIMGRVCPQDRLCEGDCTLSEGFGAISIGAIETFISEKGFEKGLKPRFAKKKRNKKVAIIGSGPAGLSAATFLLRDGFKVTIFEREDRAGGLLTYGIPGFKLDKEVVQRRVELLCEAGLDLRLSCEVGKDIAFSEIQKSYDAVFLGIGATKQKSAGIFNESAHGCYGAMEFLTNIQKRLFEIDVNEKIDVKDKNVVVIGGGDTAMDCVRTSIREGAKSAKILYRRDEANMPGSKKEVKNAKEEGAEFLFQTAPKGIRVDKKGYVVGLEYFKTEMGVKDKSGRQSCKVLEDSVEQLDADVVIFSLGFDCEVPKFLSESNIQTDDWGQIKINEYRETSLKNVYAGGDCQRGANLVVNAALDGREAAREIIKRLLS